MNFHETAAGQRFYGKQFPELLSELSRLTAALQVLAAAMPKAAPALMQSVQAPPDFLKNLYYGNYEPDMEKDPIRTKQFTKAVIDCQRQLKEQVSNDIWEQIESYHSVLNEQALFNSEQSFEAGFRSAIRMIAAGLSAPPCPPERTDPDD